MTHGKDTVACFTLYPVIFVSLLHNVSSWKFSGNGFLRHPPHRRQIMSDLWIRLCTERNNGHPLCWVKTQPLFQNFLQNSSLWYHLPVNSFGIFLKTAYKLCPNLHKPRSPSRKEGNKVTVYDENVISRINKNYCIARHGNNQRRNQLI